MTANLKAAARLSNFQINKSQNFEIIERNVNETNNDYGKIS